MGGAAYNPAMRMIVVLLSLLAIATGGAFMWSQSAQQQAELRMRMWIARLAPLGALRYQAMQAPAPWRRGGLDGLRLEPTAEWLSRLHWSADAQPRVERIDLVEYAGARPELPERLRVSIHGLHLPLAAAKAAAATAVDPAYNPLPSLTELGHSELLLNGTLELRYSPVSQSLRLQLALSDASAGALQLDCALLAGPEIFQGQFERVALERCRFEYRDLGVLSKMKSLMAGRGRVGIETLDEALVTRLDAEIRQRALPLPDADVEALATFIRKPQALRISLDPPGSPEWRNLRLYSPAELVSTLGVGIALPAAPP